MFLLIEYTGVEGFRNTNRDVFAEIKKLLVVLSIGMHTSIRIN